MGMIRDGGQERRVHHGRAQPLQHRAQQPDGILRDENGQPDSSRLNDHALGDKALTPMNDHHSITTPPDGGSPSGLGAGHFS
jgi:hypothetical protein